MYLPATYGKPSPIQPGRQSFDRIIAADCLWMPSQHENLVNTILYHLGPSDRAGEIYSDNGETPTSALVIAGFHTGRAIVRGFFDIAIGPQGLPVAGLKAGQPMEKLRCQDAAAEGGPNRRTEESDHTPLLAVEEIFEIDISGQRRPWQSDREGESREEAKRWCVCAVLVRR